MIDDAFMQDHERFFKGLGLEPAEIKMLGSILGEMTRDEASPAVDFDTIKDIILRKGGRENMAIAALATLRAYHGDKLIYLLVGSMMSKFASGSSQAH